MKHSITLLVAVGFFVLGSVSTSISENTATNTNGGNGMELGAFSVSLSVKDIAVSRAFYEKLGFEIKGGDQSQNWLIMRNGTTTIGLFQGMFPKNSLTFNPGWDQGAETLDTFQDVRDIQTHLKESGIELVLEADPKSTGPAHVTFEDPDGNPILIDQHVDRK